MDDNNLTKKSLMFIGGYYFAIIFLTSCALYDIVLSQINGFTFGYVFALFYFIFRLKSVRQLIEEKEYRK